MKIEIKPATIKRIEKMGGTLTDIAVNKAIDILTGEDELQKSKKKKKPPRPQNRDLTKYWFKDKQLSKRRLVVEVIKDWVETNKPQNIEELMDVFPQDIAPNRTFALFSEVNDKNKRRYFTKYKDDRIYFDDGTCYVVSGEWGSYRHKAFVEVARGLGYDIEEVV